MRGRSPRPRNSPTLADIARAVGVSTATVSYVLNNKQVNRISATTRARILAAAKTFHYKPDPRAVSLATGRTRVIAVYFPRALEHALDDIHSGQVLRGIVQKCALADYAVQVLSSAHDLSSCPADGWITVFSSEKPALLNGKNIVHLEPSSQSGSSGLRADHTGAGRLLGGHLRSSALKVLLVRPQTLSALAHIQKVRFDWLTAHLDTAVRIDTCEGKTEESTAELAARAVRSARDVGYDTLVAAQDDLGASLISELLSVGIRVPGEIQVAAFGMTGYQPICRPPLTTVDPGMQELGYRAASQLIAKLEKSGSKAIYGSPKPQLVKGGSTR
jgi:DNA-binding LacI/PurR family transcriptional regulator